MRSCDAVMRQGEVPHQPAGHTVDHDPLRKVHGVGDGQNHQPGLSPRRPIKQIVHHVLLPGPQQVQLQTGNVTHAIRQEVLLRLGGGGEWSFFPKGNAHFVHQQHGSLLPGRRVAEASLQ